MPEVSIIIPVFNSENYIERCIKSVLCQTFKDIEIIIVNDGSTDKSLSICKKLAENDNKILIINQKNSGVSIARNKGLDCAEGKYISFIDSDDFVANDMIEFLVDNIKKYDSDIATCGICDCYAQSDGTIEKKYGKNKNQRGIIDCREAMQEIFINGKVSLFAYDKLYRREIFDNLRFPEGKIYEDAAIMPMVIQKVKKIYYDFTPKYFYVKHKNSITSSKFKCQDMDIIKVSKKNFEFIKTRHPYAMKQAEFRFFWSHLALIDKMIWSHSDSESLEHILQFVKKNKFNILKNRYFTFKRRLMFILMIISIDFYKKFIIVAHSKGRL